MIRTASLRRPLALAGALALVLAACSSGAASPLPTLAPGSAAPSSSRSACPTSQPPALPAGETRTVEIKTAKGPITLKIEGSLAPIAAGNFVALASCGYYNGVVFHRLAPGFVIQGGDPTGTGGGGPGYTIEDEPVTAAFHRGTLAMARTPDPHSEGSQFFIVLSDDVGPGLATANPGYAIFGEVTAGMETVDAIAAMPNSGEPNNTAIDPVAMDSVTVSNP